MQLASKRALSLRNNYRPSEVLVGFSPKLQSSLPGTCKDLYLAYNQPEVPSLRDIAQAYGEEFCANSFMKAHMVKVNEFVGVKSKIEDEQLADLCYQILSEYGYLNAFEFIVFCGRLRAGQYEDFYGSVDPMRILKSLASFCRDRWSDIDRAEREIEHKRKEAEWEEQRQNAVSFDEWFLRCEDENAIKSAVLMCGREKWEKLMAQREAMRQQKKSSQ